MTDRWSLAPVGFPVMRACLTPSVVFHGKSPHPIGCLPRQVGDTPFPSGECPSLFPLPPLYPGTSTDGPLPTHVHKRGHGSAGCDGDCMTLGVWVDGGPGEVGNWTAAPGVPLEEVTIDTGAFYASKDFFDKPHGRRINWGWATIPGGVQSMARVITYHPTLKQLIHSPAPEYDTLHSPTALAKLGATKLQPYKALGLGDWAEGAGNASDVTVVFKLPTEPGTIGVSALGCQPCPTPLASARYRAIMALRFRALITDEGRPVTPTPAHSLPVHPLQSAQICLATGLKSSPAPSLLSPLLLPPPTNPPISSLGYHRCSA